MFGREERLAKLYHLVNFDKEVKTRCEYIYRIVNIRTIDVIDILHIIEYISPENKEGILPVATLSIALYVLYRSMSASGVAPEVTIFSSALETSINIPLP